MASPRVSARRFRIASILLAFCFPWLPSASLAQGQESCKKEEVEKQAALTAGEITEMVKEKVPDQAILRALDRHTRTAFTAKDLVELKQAGASDPLLKALVSDDPIYVGWSVIPAKVLRDNFGRYVWQRYFGIDVALANRSEDTGLFVTAFEFCTQDLKEVSSDPALVRGSLVKGEMTGRRRIILSLIRSTAAVLTPVQGFFKNQAHHDNFVTGVNILAPVESGFNLVWRDTIQTYLDNWDKDEVFKKGFIVAAGAPPVRGRIFIPIDLIFPCPRPATAAQQETCKKQKQARKGRYSPDEVKRAIGILVVLGQDVSLQGPRRLTETPQP